MFRLSSTALVTGSNGGYLIIASVIVFATMHNVIVFENQFCLWKLYM